MRLATAVDALHLGESLQIWSGVPWHYGSPIKEQRALAAGRALVDLGNYDVIRLTGKDCLQLLNALTSQLVIDLQVGQTAELLDLNPQGHILHQALLTRSSEAVWLLMEPGQGKSFSAYLQQMVFWADAQVELLESGFVVVAAMRTAAGFPAEVVEVFSTHALAHWVDPWAYALGRSVEKTGCIGDVVDVQVSSAVFLPDSASYLSSDFVLEDHPGLSWFPEFWLLPAGVFAEVERMYSCWAGIQAFHALRTFAWRPSINFDTDGRTLPAELDWLRSAVHLHKGCYRGQESVARVLNLGKVPRRLVFLSIDGSQEPTLAAGCPIWSDARKVGQLISSFYHYEEGPMGLAIVRRQCPVAEVLIGETPETGVAASQQEIVSSFGKADVSPVERPGSNLQVISRI